MYGCRDASHGWMKDWQALLASGGYQVGEANPALFSMRTSSHVEQFMVMIFTFWARSLRLMT